MSLSFDELFVRTAHVRKIAELVRLVAVETDSPTEAENRAKDLEYPNHLVRETRLLALAKRDHGDLFERRIAVLNKKADPWRYFDCAFIADRPPRNEEFGILAVKPRLPLPPLFWTYALYDVEGEKLFSEDGMLSNQTYSVIVSGSSKSIPIGLKMVVFGASHLIEFSYIDPASRRRDIWRVNTKGYPTESDYWHWVEGSNASVCFRPVADEDKREGNDVIASERYVLEITDFESRYREIDKVRGWMFEKYVVRGLYFFVSPWENLARFSQLGGRQISRRSMAHYGMDEVVSVAHSVSVGGLQEQPSQRPIEKMVSAMIRGMPLSVKSLHTLHNLFSFKYAYMTCYNMGNSDMPLVTF